MRNEAFTLSPAQAAMTATRARQLRPMVGKNVRVEYVKRDGSPSASTGIVETLVTKGSHGHVVIDTTPTKGRPSTVNLWSITRVTRMGDADGMVVI